MSFYGDHPWILIPTAYLLMSLVAFIAYALDKRAARRGEWRTPESTLHALELLCGWPVPAHSLRERETAFGLLRTTFLEMWPAVCVPEKLLKKRGSFTRPEVARVRVVEDVVMPVG